jgi:hypothetical protein
MNRHPTLSAPAAAAEEEHDECTCSICLAAFNTSEDDGVPRLLKCGHSFCTACLTHLLGSSTPAPAPASAEAEQATCPLRCSKCRTVTQEHRQAAAASHLIRKRRHVGSGGGLPPRVAWKRRLAGDAAEAAGAGTAAATNASSVLRNYTVMQAAQRTVSPGDQLKSPCGPL